MTLKLCCCLHLELLVQIDVQQILVDWFTPSALPRHAAAAYELAKAGLSRVKIGEALGFSKRQALFCSRLGAKMAAAGLTDPFVRLTERPEKVSRWNRVRGDRVTDKEQRRAS